jgi:uncharacterized protein (TIGR02145 family)
MKQIYTLGLSFLLFFFALQVKAEGPAPWLTLLLKQPIPTVESAGQIWMDRNLGAIQVANRYDDPHSFGYLYQWGRGSDGHQKRSSGTTTKTSESDSPGHGNFIIPAYATRSDWRATPNNNLWEGMDGVNNPCPAGFRLPTKQELEVELASWQTSTTEGAFTSPLRLSAGGARGHGIGYIGRGYYWSGTSAIFSGDRPYDYSYALTFTIVHAEIDWFQRASGLSVRCIKD